MPERKTIDAARRDKKQGKSASTQAGEFVDEEMHHIREGKHGARSAKQAIAIGLSKARRAGINLPPGKNASAATKRKAAQDSAHAGDGAMPVSARRSRATSAALKREGQAAASTTALSRHGKTAAKQRGPAARKASAEKAVRTKGAAGRRTAAKKAARTRSSGG